MWQTLLSGYELADVGLYSGGIAILIGALFGCGVAILFVGLQRALDARTAPLRDRFENLNIAGLPAPVEAKPRRGGRARRRGAPYVDIESSASSRSYTMRMARELARADLKITVGEFTLLQVVLASVGALLGVALPFGGRILLALVLFALGFWGPRYFVTRKRRARQAAFNGQLADVVTLMSGSLRAGYSLLQSMEMVAREGPSPVSTEFDRVVREVGLGLSPEEALSNLVERMQSEDLELLVTAINVQREVGGNLVEVLETISNTIRERVKLMGEVKVLTAQQQFSGYIIAMLPVALALLLAIINPSYMLGVFQTTLWCGWTMVGCSSIMILTGFLVIRQIVNIKV